MPLRDRIFGRRRLTPTVLVAASAPLRDAPSRLRTQSRRNDWQTRVWSIWDLIPVVEDTHLNFGGLVSRVPWFAGIKIGDQDPIPFQQYLKAITDEQVPIVPLPGLDPATTIAVAREVDSLLSDVRARHGGSAGFKQELTLNLTVVGDCTVHVTEDRNGVDVFDVLSIDEICATHHREISASGEELVIFERTEPGQRTGGQPIPVDDPLFRVWNPDPRHSDWAISRSKAGLEAMEEFLLIRAGNKAWASSRLAQAGVLLYDKSRFGNTKRQGAQTTAGGDTYSAGPASTVAPTAHPVFAAFAEALMAAREDPMSAAAMVPVTIGVDGPATEDILRAWTPSLPSETELHSRLAFLAEQMAFALPLPIDQIVRQADMNHWNAWLIDDQAAKVYVDPIVRLETEAVGDEWVRPGIKLAFPNLPTTTLQSIVVGYDLAPVVVKPNQVNDYRDAVDRDVVSAAAYRRVLGASEADAPSDEEMAVRNEMRRSSVGRTPTPVDGPPEASVMPRALTAAISPRQLERVTSGLARIDAQLGVQVLEKAQAAVDSSVRFVGGQIRRSAQADSATKQVLSGVPASQVAAVLEKEFGRAWFDSLEVPTDELIEQSLDEQLHEEFLALLLLAQRKSVELVLTIPGTSLPGTPTDEPGITAAQAEIDETNRDLAWVSLLAVLTTVTNDALFPASAAAPTIEGEPVIAGRVPIGSVRESLAVAGGSNPTVGASGGIGPAVPEQAITPTGGVASGDTVVGIIQTAPLTVVWEWVYAFYGSPAREFEPHAALDGGEFQGLTDPGLLNSAGEWPYVDYWHPGDHGGCMCGFELKLVEQENSEDA